jgi:hypothetical protein
LLLDIFGLRRNMGKQQRQQQAAEYSVSHEEGMVFSSH